jgi:hypothetical protein
MWDGFLSNVTSSFSYANKGVHDSISLVTTLLKLSPPPPQVETSKNKLDNQKLVANALARIPKAVDPQIAQAFNNAEGKKKKLFGNLIANPNQYPKLSESDKILVTQHVIQDLKRLSNTHTKPIDSIIARISVAGNNSFIDKYQASVISDYYTELYDTKKREIPVAIKIPPSFQCQRGADPRHGGAGGGDTTDRRSKNAFTPPPVLFLNPRRSENRTPAQLQRSAEMRNRMDAHILSTRETEKNHPAGNKPTTNLPQQNQSQTRLTGQGAINQVLRNGMRPTRYQSGDEKKEKEQDLENIGKKLAKLDFELSQIEIRKGNLDKVKNRPGLGSHNKRGTSEYKNDESEKRLKIKVLNEDLLNNYIPSDINKVYAARNKELKRLINTPSLSPSAPLVATRPSLGHLTMR